MLRQLVKVFIVSITILSCIGVEDLNCNLSSELIEEIKGYQDVVNQIVEEITEGRFKGKTYDALLEMTDLFGPRMSCTDGLEKSIDYAVKKMNENNLENVHTEEVRNIPNWKRGYESAKLIKPWKKTLHILGLGTTVGTPEGGITENVFAYESFEEFRNSTDNVKGKIVLFVPKWIDYPKMSLYRRLSATEAAKRGAIAALVKSVSSFGINTPHTGYQNYAEGVEKIPVASLTVEDAEMILRMFRKGQEILINLEMDDHNEGDCVSRNTIAELQGREFINENVVVVSGHFDSWDVGVGAMDDGGGSMISWKTVEFLKALNLRPRRTIRAILFASEEQGCIGSIRYHRAHRDNEAKEFNFLMQSDSGTFDPVGLDFSGNNEASCIVKEILKLMVPLNATRFEKPAYGAPDLTTFRNEGFPVASLLNRNDKYFWYHHTNGDMMELWKDKTALDKCTALFAAFSYVIADLSVNIPKDLVETTLPLIQSFG